MKYVAGAIAAVGIVWAMAWCGMNGREAELANDAKHIEMGHCRDGWGVWGTCK